MLALLLIAAVASALPTCLITGATGRLGQELYFRARASGEYAEVRALATSAESARSALNCSLCDASEGIYIGNVTDAASLTAAAAGANVALIAVGAGYSDSAEMQRAVEFDGVLNTLAAVVAGGAASPHVILCSSMGTTDPSPSAGEGGSVLFWKLNAEAALLGSSVRSTVVKPCGLSMQKGTAKPLLVGQNDALLSLKVPLVARADVARVMLAAVKTATTGRFDLCAELTGAPTTDEDLPALLRASQYPQ